VNRTARLILALAIAVLSASPARAQVLLSDNPAAVLGAGLEEHRGAAVPEGLTFTDAQGQPVEFSSFFDGKRPVVLVLGYYDCPLLCPWVFSSLQGSFNTLAWQVGKEYRVVAVSIDPTNTPEQAAEQQRKSLSGLRRGEAPGGWEFLLSDDVNAARLAEAVGFKYAYLPDTDEYVHPGVVIVLSPTGVVSQYLQVSPLPEKQLRLSLMDAADGKIGSLIDKFIFSCHVYDPDAGSYVFHARTLMNAAGVLTAVAIFATVGALLLSERRRRRRAAAKDSTRFTDPTEEPPAGLSAAVK